MYKLQGVIPAMVTPFKEDRSIDEKGLQILVKKLSDQGCHGILIGGSTGEYTLMSIEERKKIFQLAVEAAKDEPVAIIANTGCHATEHTIKLSQSAQKAGVDAVMVLPTYYLKTTKEGIKNHYKNISKKLDIPMTIYHYPEATNVLLSPEEIIELSKIENIIGIKNTAPMQHTSKLLHLTKDMDKFDVLTGYEHLFLSTLACGGSGVIGIVNNIVAEELVEMYNLIQMGDIKKARTVNDSLINLYSLMEEEPCPGPVKAALNKMGWPAGPSRLPIVPASEEMKKKIEVELKKLGKI
ncbi:MAG: 4-hydroxy-tetrahydrodipicolinate synthase [Halanaerobiales bacterium]|nr:4-hydroxy-tetrahydrodipicolinate synthase [Halanaerobiales bacterium]